LEEYDSFSDRVIYYFELFLAAVEMCKSEKAVVTIKSECCQVIWRDETTWSRWVTTGPDLQRQRKNDEGVIVLTFKRCRSEAQPGRFQDQGSSCFLQASKAKESYQRKRHIGNF
jgi:hypothetical protein